jgi:hypothetical protein
MPYNSNGIGAIVPVERIKPILANMIGDGTAGGNANIQDYLDARRFIRAKVANVTARNGLTSPQDGDLVLVLDNGSGYTQLDRYKSSTSGWVTVAVEGGTSGGGGGSGGGSGAFKSPVRAATVSTLPTNTRTGNVLTASANGTLSAVDGVTLIATDRVLVKDEATASKNGIYTVTSVGSAGAPWVLTRAEDADTEAELPAGSMVVVCEGTVNADRTFVLSADAPLTLNTSSLTFAPVGNGAMSVPVVVAANAGTSNATYAVPGAGLEMVWKGGAIQVRDADYTRSGNTITFVAGNIPAAGEDVVISTAVSAVVGTDAQTLAGASSANTATAATVALRGADATLKAANHASIGTAAAAGAVVALDATGKIPSAALSTVVISAADVAALKAVASPPQDAVATVPGLGIYVFDTTYAGAFDDEAAVQPTTGSGGWMLRAPSAEVVYAHLIPEFVVRDQDIQLLVEAYNDLATKFNDLAIKFNAHTHTYNPTLTSTLVASSAHNQTAASTDARTTITYTSEL